MNQECNNNQAQELLVSLSHEQQEQQQKRREQQKQQLKQQRNIPNNKMIMNTRPSVELNSFNDPHHEFLRATSLSLSSSSSPSPSSSLSSKTTTTIGIVKNDIIHSSTSSSASSNSAVEKLVYGKPTNLGLHFQPGPYDCICGRGKVAFNHVGNKYFRSLIELARNSYLKAETKIQRSSVVSNVVNAVRSKCGGTGGAGFVKQNKLTGEWIEVGDHLAREKVGQSLRETLAIKYKSSHKAKKYRRKETSTKVNQTLEDIIHTNTNISTIIQYMTNKVTMESSDALPSHPDQYQPQQQQQQQPQQQHQLQQSDEELVQLFNESNSQILFLLKQDQPMVQRFQEAYIQSGKNNRNRNSNNSSNDDSSDNNDDSGKSDNIGGIMMMEYESIPSSWMME